MFQNSLARISLVAFIAAGSFVGSANAMSLSEAAGLTVATNPQMEAAQENRRAQVYELRQAHGLYMPSLDFQGGVGKEWTDNQTVQSRWLTRAESQLSLTQLLFDGFAREAKVDQRAARLDAAALRVGERAQVLSLDAAEVYLDVLRNQELVAIAEENVSVHQELLDRVVERVEGGQSGVGDRQQSDSRYAASQDSLIQAQQDLSDSMARFLRVVGIEPRDLDNAPSVVEALPPSQRDAAHLAVSNSPTVAASAADIDDVAAQRREALGNFWPTLSMELAGRRQQNIDGVVGNNDDVTALLRVDWNLFRGGIDVARRTELAHRIGQARAETMEVERQVAEEARLSWNALEAARKRVEVLDGQVLSNAQVVQTYRQEFLVGQRSLLDLLDSENEMFLARGRLVTAQYVEQFAQYRLLAVMGELTTVLGVQPPSEAATGARKDAGVTPDYVPGSASEAGANKAM